MFVSPGTGIAVCILAEGADHFKVCCALRQYFDSDDGPWRPMPQSTGPISKVNHREPRASVMRTRRVGACTSEAVSCVLGRALDERQAAEAALSGSIRRARTVAKVPFSTQEGAPRVED